MEKQVEQVAADVGPPPQALQESPKVNRGRFRRGDPRINREGRPRGTPKKPDEPRQGLELRAKSTDRLAWFGYLTAWLAELIQPAGGRKARTNSLPSDWRIVTVRVVGEELAQVVIRSKSLPRIAEGAVIPELKPRWGG